jgi:translation initiation factor 1A
MIYRRCKKGGFRGPGQVLLRHTSLGQRSSDSLFGKVQRFGDIFPKFVLAGKGGKNRRRGKNESDEKRELIFREDGQEYAQVLRMLGNGRLEAYCMDGVKRLCHIRGKMRKKVWVNTGDIVLVGLREYQDEKADVILKYMADEARSLKQYGELPENIRVNDTDALVDDDIDAEEDLVDFEDVDDI